MPGETNNTNTNTETSEKKQYFLDWESVGGFSANLKDILKLLPEQETRPGRSQATENDLSQWTMSDLADMITEINYKKIPVTVEHPGVDGKYQLTDPEAAEQLAPYMREAGKRLQEYLANPDYSAEKRPILNALLREAEILPRMMDSGISFSMAMITNGRSGLSASRQIMDVVYPKEENVNPEIRKKHLNEYEKQVQEGPFFKLVHIGLDHMELMGEYEKARQDKEHPMTAEQREAFENRVRETHTQMMQGIKEVADTLNDEKFNLEDYPYMNKVTVDNLKHNRALPAAQRRCAREVALLNAGLHLEDYNDIYSIEYNVNHLLDNARLKDILTDPAMQTDPEMMRFTALLEMGKDLTDGIIENPDKLAGLRDRLKEQGISLYAYTRALQHEIRDTAQKLSGNMQLSENERRFMEYAGNYMKENEVNYIHPVGTTALVNAGEYIKKTSKEMTEMVDGLVSESKGQDRALDQEVQELGYSMPEGWQPGKDSAELISSKTVYELQGASVKMSGVLSDEKGKQYHSRYNDLTGTVTGLLKNKAALCNATGVTSVYPKDVQIEEDGKMITIHPEEEMRQIMKDMNRDVREAAKKIPQANKLQHAMLDYVECFSREALELKEPVIDGGKDAMAALGNSYWANITEPGTGKNKKWEEVERVNEQFGYHHLIKDTTSMHEIYLQNVKRANAGEIDAAKEQKEREVYGKLLDRLKDTAQNILNTPEEERKKIIPLFDATNASNAALDIFGNRGMNVAIRTAEMYKRGLEKGWPVSELPAYAAMENFRDKIDRGLALLGKDRENTNLNGSFQRLDNMLNENLDHMNEYEKAHHFKHLAECVGEIVQETKKMAGLKNVPREAKEIWGTKSVQTGYGCGGEVPNEALPDLLTEAAQRSAKREMMSDDPLISRIDDSFMPESQKHQIDDAKLAQERVGRAIVAVSTMQSEYREMYKELQGLKREGHTDSSEFKAMEDALKKIAGMGGTNTPDEWTKACRELHDAAEAYNDAKGFFSGWRSNGKARIDLASRLTEKAEKDKNTLDAFQAEKAEIPDAERDKSVYHGEVSDAREEIRNGLIRDESLNAQFMRHQNTIDRYTPEKQMEQQMYLKNQSKQQEKAKQREKELQAKKEKHLQEEKAKQERRDKKQNERGMQSEQKHMEQDALKNQK